MTKRNLACWAKTIEARFFSSKACDAGRPNADVFWKIPTYRALEPLLFEMLGLVQQVLHRLN